MADLLCKDSELIALADTIRNKKGDGSSVKYGFPTGMADAVSSLNVGVGLSPAATAADIRNGKKAVVDRITITGTMTEKAAATYNTSTTDQEIAAGQYLTGKQTIRKVTTSNLSAENIKAGVTVNVGDAGDDDRVASVAGTFTSDGTATAGNILSGKIAYVNGSKITGTIATKTSANMIVSGKTVIVPSGYYASEQSKDVATGSATTPATTITANPSIAVGLYGKIVATINKTQSITPTVSAGYVSSGTAGTITVSGSAENQLITQEATTYNTSTVDQRIDGRTFLIGNQTIKAVTTSNIIDANIKKGVTVKVGDANNAGRIKNITGTYNGPGLSYDANRTVTKTFTSFSMVPGQCKTVTVSLSISDFAFSYTADALVIVPKSINNPLSGSGYSAIKSITYNNNGTISVELLYAMWYTSQAIMVNVSSATITCDICYIPN